MRKMLTKTGRQDYRAPEMDLQAAYNEKVDLWSVGASLSFILSGIHPLNLLNQ
jgi:serine/threonine protein kinase